MTETKPPKDIGIKCYCGGTTKFNYQRKLFICDKTGEDIIFYSKHPCISK